MSEKYKIGDLSKKFGISAQTIRFYEEKGLIKPTKDSETGYRYYDTWTLNYLLDIIQLKKNSFSLSQTKDITNASSLEEISQIFNQQEVSILKQINDLQHIRDSLEHQRQIMNHFYDYQKTYHIVQSPQLLFHSYRSKNSLLPYEIDDETEEWIKMIPEAEPTFYIDSIYFNEINQINYYWGYSLPLDKSIDKNLDFINNTYIPTQNAIYTTFEAGNENTFISSLYENVIKRIINDGFQINGRPYGKLIIRNQVNKDIKRYFEIWIPINEDKKM